MIFWEGWLLKASDGGSNKWKLRFFRVRDNKFEFLDAGDREPDTAHEEAAVIAHGPQGNVIKLQQQQQQQQLTRGGGSFGSRDDGGGSGGSGQLAAATTKLGDFFNNVVSQARDAVLDDGGRRNEAMPRQQPDESECQQQQDNGDQEDVAATNKVDNKNLEVAKEVGEAPRGWLNIDEDVTGVFVFGAPSFSFDNSEWALGRHTEPSTGPHCAFHQGFAKVIIVCKPGKPTWRLGLESFAGSRLPALFNTIGPSVPRGSVLFAGWVNTPGTINWNRRYAVLLSTGNLLIFKDPSLDNLRRDLWLGDDGCVIQAVRPLWEAGSSGEQALFDSLAKSKQQAYHESVTVRLLHPSISDKKGYLMSVERGQETDPPAVHYGKFREWLRLLQAARKQAVATHQEARSMGSFPGFSGNAQRLRESLEAHLVLEQAIADNIFVPSPAMLALAKAGFPDGLRAKLWGGFFARVDAQQSKSHEAGNGGGSSDANNNYNTSGDVQGPSVTNQRFNVSKLPRARTPSFSFPLISSGGLSTDWVLLVLQQLGLTAEPRVVRNAAALLDARPDILLSCELLSIISFACDSLKIGEASATDDHDTQQMLRVVVATFLPFHVNTGCASGTVNAVLVKHHQQEVHSQPLQQQRLQPAVSLSQQKESNSFCWSIPTHVDVQIVLDIVLALHPQLPSRDIAQCKPIVARWLMSAFTLDVPFGVETSRRIWDVLVTLLEHDDPLHACNFAVRICVSIFSWMSRDLLQLHANAADDGKNVSAQVRWQEALTIPCSSSDGGEKEMLAADWVLHCATKDRHAMKLSTWSGLKDRRSQLWNSIELEARERAVLLSQWKATTKSLLDLSKMIRGVMGRVNRSKTARISGAFARNGNTLSTPSENNATNKNSEEANLLNSECHAMTAALIPLNLALCAFVSALSALEEALKLAQQSLLSITAKSCLTSTAGWGRDLEVLLDEARGCCNVRTSTGGQVTVHPSLVIQVVRTALALGWQLSAAGDYFLGIADAGTFKELRMHAACLNNRSDKRIKSPQYYSLPLPHKEDSIKASSGSKTTSNSFSGRKTSAQQESEQQQRSGSMPGSSERQRYLASITATSPSATEVSSPTITEGSGLHAHHMGAGNNGKYVAVVSKELDSKGLLQRGKTTQFKSETSAKPLGNSTLPQLSKTQSAFYSLSGLSRLLRPPSEPKPAKNLMPIGQLLHDELCKLLHSLLVHLDDIAQCVVDTSVEHQRRDTEKTFASSILVADMFGGQVSTLSRLVPFIMSSVENIRCSVLQRRRDDDLFNEEEELPPTLQEIEDLLKSQENKIAV